MTEQTRQATPADIDLVELRVGLAGLTAEVQRMRADVAPLAALPTQLQAVADLHTERLSNLDARLSREVQRLDQAMTAVEGWQTWAIRVVLAVIVAAVLGAVLVTP